MTFSYGPLHMDKLVLADQQELTYNSSVRIQKEVWMTCWERWLIEMNGERVRETCATIATWWWWWWFHINASLLICEPICLIISFKWWNVVLFRLAFSFLLFLSLHVSLFLFTSLIFSLFLSLSLHFSFFLSLHLSLYSLLSLSLLSCISLCEYNNSKS